MILVLLCAVLLALAYRAYAIRPPRPAPRRAAASPCHLAVFLGSGGHTSEALLLLASLDLARYTPRTYILARGDTLSAHRARAFEARHAPHAPPEVRPPPPAPRPQARLLAIPRARRVHQPLLTTPPTALLALLACLYHASLRPLVTRQPLADVLLVNGPGTCVALCAAVYLSRMLLIPSPRVIYVESFARVSSLSLSARLLRPFVDRFVVQWPEALKGGRRGDCPGWLV